jgi:hypothetical protein
VLAQYRNRAGEQIAGNVNNQAGNLASAQDSLGRGVAGQYDGAFSQLASLLSGSGEANSAQQIRLAELLQALASNQAASGSTAIGSAGTIGANSHLYRGDAIAGSVGDIVGGIGMVLGQ